MAANYEVNRRKAHVSNLTEVSLMGNGKSNEAERQELSGPGTSFNGKYIIPANSCLKPVTVNTKQFALYFTDLLALFYNSNPLLDPAINITPINIGAVAISSGTVTK